MSELDLIRDMFQTVNNNVLSLSATVNKSMTEAAELKGEISAIKSSVRSLRNEMIRHFDTCPVDDLRDKQDKLEDQTGAIHLEIERMRAKRSLPPPKNTGITMSWSDVRAMLPFAVAIAGMVGTWFGLSQCSANDSQAAILPKKTGVTDVNETQENNID